MWYIHTYIPGKKGYPVRVFPQLTARTPLLYWPPSAPPCGALRWLHQAAADVRQYLFLTIIGESHQGAGYIAFMWNSLGLIPLRPTQVPAVLYRQSFFSHPAEPSLDGAYNYVHQFSWAGSYPL